MCKEQIDGHGFSEETKRVVLIISCRYDISVEALIKSINTFSTIEIVDATGPSLFDSLFDDGDVSPDRLEFVIPEMIDYQEYEYFNSSPTKQQRSE